VELNTKIGILSIPGIDGEDYKIRVFNKAVSPSLYFPPQKGGQSLEAQPL